MEQLTTLIARNWWVLLLRGIAAIIFGIAAFAWPGLTISVLILIFGAFVLFDGVSGVIDAIRFRDERPNWGLWLLEGILGVVVGLAMLLMPGLTAIFMIGLIAAWSIIGGVLRIIAAIQLRREIEGEWFLILSGVLSVLFGIAILVLPTAGLLSIAWLIGFWAIAIGVLFILLAFRLRKRIA